MPVIRFIIILACLAHPIQADVNGVARKSFKLEPDRSILEINLFPIIADFDTTIYAACPIVSLGNGDEVTDCHIGITSCDGQSNSFTPLGPCTTINKWTADCPDFTSEEFTQGNRANLENVIAAEEMGNVEGSRPQPLAKQIKRGGGELLEIYRTHFFEVLTTCEGFSGEPRKICDALPISPALHFAFKSAERTTVCSLGHDNRFTDCRRDDP